jgi:LPXTG-motif cell wall-anchored protein
MQFSDKNQSLLIWSGIVIVGGTAGYFLLKKTLAASAKNSVDLTIGDSKEAQQAQGLRAAFNPSGTSWLMSTDGTNNDAVFTIANQITDLSTVATKYKALYGTNLSDDLTSELTAEELTKFYAAVNKSSAQKKSQSDLEAKFKFHYGNQLATSPKPGFTKVAYYDEPRSWISKSNTLKITHWHTKPGGYAGTVQAKLLKSVIINGKTVAKPMYGLVQVPVENFPKDQMIWMFEDELKLSK